MDAELQQNVEKIKRGIMAGELDVNTGMQWVQQLHAEAARKAAGEPEPPKRLELNCYLAKLPVESLVSLTHWAAKIGERSPKLESLIRGWITDELRRRETLEDDAVVPVEPTKPNAAGMLNWTNRELAGALTALVGPSYAVEDAEAGRLIDKVNCLVCCLSAARLTLTGGNQ